MKMQPTNKQTVLKKVRDNGVWQGYIAPNKVNEYHINNGWHIGRPIMITCDREGNTYHVVSLGDAGYNVLNLNYYLRNYEYYNCNKELGNRIRFWEV
jgi:hypothetical protein